MEEVRERLRPRLWSAKFEGWIAQHVGPNVDHKYQMLIRMLPMQLDYFPTAGYLAEDVRFRWVDDFEQYMYRYFFGHVDMLQKVLDSVQHFSAGSGGFNKCQALCSVAQRAFQLLKNDQAVPETMQVGFILNKLQRYAEIKLKEWHRDGRAKPNRIAHLLSFANDVDDLYKDTRKLNTNDRDHFISYLPDIDSKVNQRKGKVRHHLSPSHTACSTTGMHARYTRYSRSSSRSRTRSPPVGPNPLWLMEARTTTKELVPNVANKVTKLPCAGWLVKSTRKNSFKR